MTKTEKVARKAIRKRFGRIRDQKLYNALRIVIGLPGDDNQGFKSVGEAHEFCLKLGYTVKELE